MKLSIYLLLMLALVAMPHRAIAQVPFATSAYLTNGGYVCSATTADVNGDGYPDLISAYSNITNGAPGYLIVWTNNGSSLFVSNASYTVGINPHQVITADVNNDGWPDLITANYSNPSFISNPSSLTVLTNDGHGNFALSATLQEASGFESQATLISVTAADLFGHGRMDLIGADEFNWGFMIWTNSGSGMFGWYGALEANPHSTGPLHVTTADINGSGKPAIIGVTFSGTSYLDIWTNNGAGGLAAAASQPITNGHIICVVSADVNGDGKPDLILTGTDGSSLFVLTNDGTGAFALSGQYGVGNLPYAVVAADVNGDGAVDLISANRGDDTLTILTNNGGGIFSSNATLNLNSGGMAPTGYYAQPLAVADINGDGRIDLIGGNYSPGTLTVFTNAGTYLPSLKLTPSGTNIIVSWPAVWANWTLQQNADLSQGGWSSFSGTLGNDGVTKSLTNSTATGNLFFRLMH